MLSPNAPWPSCEITVWSPTGTTPYLCARYVDPAKKLPRMTPIQPSVTAAFLDSGGLKAATPSETASTPVDRKSTRLNSSHLVISYAVFFLKNKIDTIL